MASGAASAATAAAYLRRDVGVSVQRACFRCRGRPGVVRRRILPALCAVVLLVLHLRAHARCGGLAVGITFRRARLRLNAIRPATIAGATAVVVAALVVVDSDVFVDANIGAVAVHVVHCALVDVVVDAVIEEVAAIPVAALITESDVAEAVVDAAIPADVHAPVAGVPQVTAAIEAPITGSPEAAGIRRLDPHAGHPVIAIRAPGP